MKTAEIQKASYRRKHRYIEHQNSAQLWAGEHYEAPPQSMIDPSPTTPLPLRYTRLCVRSLLWLGEFLYKQM